MIGADLRVRVVEHGRVRVVHVEGEIDMLTAPRLVAAMTDAGELEGLVLDLGNVTFMSSAGVGLIASLHRQLAHRGGRLVLTGVDGNAARVLELTGLAEVVLVAPDAETAIERLASGSA